MNLSMRLISHEYIFGAKGGEKIEDSIYGYARFFSAVPL